MRDGRKKSGDRSQETEWREEARQKEKGKKGAVAMGSRRSDAGTGGYGDRGCTRGRGVQALGGESRARCPWHLTVCKGQRLAVRVLHCNMRAPCAHLWLRPKAALGVREKKGRPEERWILLAYTGSKRSKAASLAAWALDRPGRESGRA